MLAKHLEEKIFILLYSKSVTGYDIYMKTGVGQGKISELRRGHRSIENLTLKVAKVLEQAYDDYEKSGVIVRDRDFKKAMDNLKNEK